MNNTRDTWHAQYYKNNSHYQLQSGLRTIAGLTLRGDEVALDVGCGDGRITAQLAERLPNGAVLGVDLSENMIGEAQKTFGHVANMSFTHGSIVTFDTDKRFDLVVSFGTIHWIKDQLGAFKNIFRLLKPGGLMVVKISAQTRDVGVSVGTLAASAKWRPILEHNEQRWFPQTTENTRHLLEESGFSIIDVRYEERVSIHANQDELYRWFMGWVPHSTGLPLEQAQEFARDMVAAMVNEQGRTENIQRNGRLVLAIASKPE